MLMRTDIAEIDRAYMRRLEFGRKLTGRTVLAWFVVGFGVMFAANFALIYYSRSHAAWRGDSRIPMTPARSSISASPRRARRTSSAGRSM